MSKVATVCRSGGEGKCSDTLQMDLRPVLRALLRGGVACRALLIFAWKAEEEDIFSELKDVRRRFPFWCRLKLQSARCRQARKEITILQKMDHVVKTFEPDYNSEDDIADAPNVALVPPTPRETDPEKGENEGTNCSMGNKSKRKQGGRDIGQKGKRTQGRQATH